MVLPSRVGSHSHGHVGLSRPVSSYAPAQSKNSLKCRSWVDKNEREKRWQSVHYMQTTPEAFEPQRDRYKLTIWVCLAKKGCAQVLQLLGGKAFCQNSGPLPLWCAVWNEYWREWEMIRSWAGCSRQGAAETNTGVRLFVWMGNYTQFSIAKGMSRKGQEITDRGQPRSPLQHCRAA